VQERQSDRSGVGIAQRGDSLVRRAHLGGGATGVLDHDGPIGIQAQPTVHPIEEGDADLGLQPGEGA
jgi:hypothetical protein